MRENMRQDLVSDGQTVASPRHQSLVVTRTAASSLLHEDFEMHEQTGREEGRPECRPSEAHQLGPQELKLKMGH